MGQSVALSSASQRAIPPELGRISGTEVSYWKQSVLTLGFQVSSVDSTMCGIQR